MGVGLVAPFVTSSHSFFHGQMELLTFAHNVHTNTLIYTPINQYTHQYSTNYDWIDSYFIIIYYQYLCCRLACFIN